MAMTLHLPELPTIVDIDKLISDVSFLEKLESSKQKWTLAMLLAMAVRDGASSVHYHPWRSGEELWYVAQGQRFTLLTPDSESCTALLYDAKQLVANGLVARLSAWMSGCAYGQVRLVNETGESQWGVVYWSRGQLAGMEFLRH